MHLDRSLRGALVCKQQLQLVTCGWGGLSTTSQSHKLVALWYSAFGASASKSTNGCARTGYVQSCGCCQEPRAPTRSGDGGPLRNRSIEMQRTIEEVVDMRDQARDEAARYPLGQRL